MRSGTDAVPRVRVVGPGRAGTSLAHALRHVGWDVDLLDRDAQVADAAEGVDLLLL